MVNYTPQKVYTEDVEWINKNIPGTSFAERVNHLIKGLYDWHPAYGLRNDLRKMMGAKNGRTNQ